jgi:predicted RNase H-like HicB family nuclease
MDFASPGLRREEAMREFVAVIHQGTDGAYHVSFPDLPGVMVADEAIEHARIRAEYALFHHIRRRMAEDRAIPEPLSLEAILADPRNRDALQTITPLAFIEIDDDDDVDGEV